MLQMLGSKIQVEMQEERDDVTESGIVIKTAQGTRPSQEHLGRKGKVVAIGPEVEEVKVGDVVLWGEFDYKNWTEGGKKYQIIGEADICAVLEE